MPLSFSRRLALLLFVALALSDEASAQTAATDQQLDDFVRLTQFASPYGRADQIPEQWCYYTKTDQTYDWWYFTPPKSGILGPVQARGSFAIPFMFDSYGTPRQGAIIVGYAIDGDTQSTKLASPSFSKPAECRIGTDILLRSPYPVSGVAADLALTTMIDPAPEYHYWPLLGRYYAVRSILAIPASFKIGNEDVAGRIIVAFSAH